MVFFLHFASLFVLMSSEYLLFQWEVKKCYIDMYLSMQSSLSFWLNFGIRWFCFD